MNDKALKRFAMISEILGGLAVIVTLIILIFEVRGNTQAVRAATYDSLVGSLVDQRMAMITDNELQEMDFVQASEGREAFTPRQSRMFFNLFVSRFQNYERAYTQWRAGNLDDDSWERFKLRICNDSGNPAFEVNVGSEIDRLTTASFTDFRKNQCK